ncbi:hypothetical protein BLJ79_04530 [Arthrobacter sp. UCD-GKA]|nr:hypothetical protein BLJ79_04530 [Arthrobacter sp. UCD-GKA]
MFLSAAVPGGLGFFQDQTIDGQRKQFTMREANGSTQLHEGKSRIVITRSVEVTPQRLWETFTDATALAGWIGVLRTDEATGKRTFSMLEGVQESDPEELDITRCRAPHELEYTTTSKFGGWGMGLVIRPAAGGCELEFHQVLGDADDPRNMGPGWEYYMQRAIAHTLGEDPDEVAWDEFYPALADAYAPAPGQQ